MSRLSRHLGKPVKLELMNEEGEKDTFLIKPLLFEDMPDFYSLVKMMMNNNLEDIKEAVTEEEKKEQSKKIMEILDKDSLLLIKKLIKSTVKNSFPEETEDVRAQFAQTHMFELMNVMFEVNSHGGPKVKDK